MDKRYLSALLFSFQWNFVTLSTLLLVLIGLLVPYGLAYEKTIDKFSNTWTYQLVDKDIGIGRYYEPSCLSCDLTLHLSGSDDVIVPEKITDLLSNQNLIVKGSVKSERIEVLADKTTIEKDCQQITETSKNPDGKNSTDIVTHRNVCSDKTITTQEWQDLNTMKSYILKTKGGVYLNVKLNLALDNNGEASVDAIPSILGEKDYSLAWFNISLPAKMLIFITEKLGQSKVNEQQEASINTSGEHAIVSCKEIWLVDNSSTSIPYQVLENSMPNCRILFLYSQNRTTSTDNTTTYSAYYNNSAAINPLANTSMRIVKKDFEDATTTNWVSAGDYPAETLLSVSTTNKTSGSYSLNITGTGAHNELSFSYFPLGEQNVVWIAKMLSVNVATPQIYILGRGTGTNPASYYGARYIYPATGQIAIDHPNTETYNFTSPVLLTYNNWNMVKLRTNGATSANMEFTTWALDTNEYSELDIFYNGIAVTGSSQNFGFGMYTLTGSQKTILVDDVEAWSPTYEPRFYSLSSTSSTGEEVLLFPPLVPISNSTNSTLAGSPILHSLDWIGNFSSGYIFQICNGTWTGSSCPSAWINNTWSAFTTSWSNVTVLVNSTNNANMAWLFYANDTTNNWNKSGTFSYLTNITAVMPPAVVMNATTVWTTYFCLDEKHAVKNTTLCQYMNQNCSTALEAEECQSSCTDNHCAPDSFIVNVSLILITLGLMVFVKYVIYRR